MVKFCELRQKEVINVNDGTRLGFVSDIVIEEICGKIITLIIPKTNKVFGFFGYDQEYQVPYACITQIGDDIILVDVNSDKCLIDV